MLESMATAQSSSRAFRALALAALAALAVALLALASASAGLMSPLGLELAALVILATLLSFAASLVDLAQSLRGLAGSSLWLRALGAMGRVAVWAALTLPAFYCLTPAMGLSSILLTPTLVLLVASSWSYARRQRLATATATVSSSPGRVTAVRGGLLALALVATLYELVADPQAPGYGRRFVWLLGRALGLSPGSLSVLSFLHGAALTLVGAFGLVWGAPPRFEPIKTTYLIVAARVGMASALALSLALWFENRLDWSPILLALPYALAAVGAFCLAFETWDAKRREGLTRAAQHPGEAYR